MAINLSRNTKVYFTTNVDAEGTLPDVATAYSSSNTFELQVLDGYSFSQANDSQTINVTEAGASPLRGSRTFNTQLNAADWSLSTYIRPLKSTTVTAAERVLWNAAMGSHLLDTTGQAVSSLTRGTTLTPTASIVTAAALVYNDRHNASATAAVTATSTALAAGLPVNVIGATSSTDWNRAAVIRSVAGTGPYTYTVEYSKAPGTAAGTTATGTAIKILAGQWGTDAAFSYVSTVGSNRHQLQKFGLIFVVDNVLYGIDNCAVGQVSIDFGLDQIATAAWSGQGTKVKKLSTLTAANLATSSTTASTSAKYITNKLSTVTLESKIGGSEAGGSTTYTVPITGGNLTINNNLNYLIPSNLGVINEAVAYYTGSRTINGNLTAYLKTGTAGDAGSLLDSLLSGGGNSGIEPKFRLQLEMGGSSNSTRVEFEMPGTMLQVPDINIADVVSTTINFTAEPFDPTVSTQTFDLERSNDLTVRYYAP